MKRCRILWVFLLALILTAGLLPAGGAFAAEQTTYTVRIFPGNRGVIDGSAEPLVYENQPYGQEIIFDYDARVSVTQSKYYVRGIRESGRDNNTVDAPRIVVTHDVDYVVAYGVLSKPVTFEIRYEDRDGNEIAGRRTCQGNEGDRPIIAYEHIEGYEPYDAYNLTGTLGQKDTWVFTYTKVTAPASSGTGTTTGGGTSTGRTGTTGTGTGTGGTGTGTGTGAGTGGTGTGTGTGTGGTEPGGTSGTETPGTGTQPGGEGTGGQ